MEIKKQLWKYKNVVSKKKLEVKKEVERKKAVGSEKKS